MSNAARGNALFNIVWICTEHHRFDTIRALGNEFINTPNLDRLVGQGTAFTHAFAQNTVCTPSRSSFLTGRYPVTTRCRQNGQDIPADEIIIPRMLRNAGYECGLAGKLHISAAASGQERRIDDGYNYYRWSHGCTAKHGGDWVAWLQKQGKTFDEVYRPNGILLSRTVSARKYHQTTWCFERAREFIDQQDADQPWLVSINPFSTHDPFDILEEFYRKYDPASLPLPRMREGELAGKPACQQERYTEHADAFTLNKTADQMTGDELRVMKAAYYATIEHIDFELGRFMDYLEANGLRENTLIIFNADHGDMLGDHGLLRKGPFMYDPALRVPLILCLPGVVPVGQLVHGLVEQVDIAPTLLELLGMEIPARMQGRSLLPLIRKEIPEHAHRNGVYAEYYNSNRSLAGRPVFATMWRESKCKIVVHHGEDLGELYDLENDPHEFVNLWDEPEYRDLKLRLMKQCFDARAFTLDPLPEKREIF